MTVRPEVPEFPAPEPAPDLPQMHSTVATDEVPNYQAGDDFRPFEEQPPAEPKRTVRLGENRKRASGVRQLTQADLKQLRAYYDSMAMMTMMVRPAAAKAISECADECVQRWEDLAKQNDKVRKTILATLEGGAWSAVFAAHLPIILACVPEKAYERLPGLFGMNPQDDETEE